MTEGYKFKINEIEKLDNGCKYSISLELPMKDGWFEDVYFCVQKGRDLIPIKLKHKDELLTDDEEDEYVLYTKKFSKPFYDLLKYYEGIEEDINDDEMILMSKKCGLYGLENILFGGQL